ncbi:hypothetical protein M2140_000120 [Clostridiales Family XIII bacterium PM5-7]
MILITKDEAEFIRKNSKNCRIVTTGKSKNKRQKKRYVDEISETYKLLRKFHKKKKVR